MLTSLVCILTAMPLTAQPSWVKKASKAVFTLKTFDEQGSLLGSSTGFFVGEQGEAISNYMPFKGAARAVVIDAADKEYEVECILGANETYDVTKFRVKLKKSQPLALSTVPLTVGKNAWMLPYHEQKKVPQATVRKTEEFGGNSYYTLVMQMPEGSTGAPLLNEEGLVVGVMQQPMTTADTLTYAVGVTLADSLHTNGLSINDPTLRAIGIKKAMPAELSQAQLALYIGAQSLDSAAYATFVNDFIAQFPQAADGYIQRAQLATTAHRFEQADNDMQQALEMSDKKDEVHYNYSRLIYQKMLYMATEPYEPWTFEKALQEARDAYAVNPQPTYQHQEAYVLYSLQRYQEAYDVYMKLSQSNLRSADVFFEASNCQLMMGDTLQQLALLDSAVALFSKPYLREAAPYILARAQARLDAGRHRDAVNDLNDYEGLMMTQLNANFYYLRFQAEVGGRLYQQALNDIDQAISMMPQYDLYYAEKASLQVRVGLYEDAVETARQCIKANPEGSDGYLFLGVSQCLSGQKAEGVKNLQKAKELGDPQADSLIEKYSK